MSDFSLPPLAVDYDTRWIGVPPRGDIREWARQAAARYVARMGGDERRLRTLLEGGAELLRNADDWSMALLLIPVAAEGVRAAVRFCPVEIAGLEEEQAWPTLLRQLFPDEPRDEPAEITEIVTKAGLCRRVVHRNASGGDDAREAGEQIAYVWLFPTHGAAVLMMTSFPRPAEIGRWQPVVDELAAAVELEQESLSGAGSKAATLSVPASTATGITAGAHPTVLTIRPVKPEGRLHPADNAVLEKWLLCADPAAGTLELSEDRAFIITPARHLTFRLPATGHPDAVRTICIATYDWFRNLQTGTGWRLLFLDARGRVVGQGRRRDAPRASQLWPRRIFEALQPLGIDVVEESYKTEKHFKRGHPDA